MTGRPPALDGEAGAVGVAEIVEVDVVAPQADLSLVGGEGDADGEFAERVLDAFAEEDEVGAAEAIVRIAGEHGGAVDVGAADGGGEIEGDHGAAVSERLGEEGAQGDGAFELLGGGDDGAGSSGIFFDFGCRLHGDVAAGAGAVVGAVVLEVG